MSDVAALIEAILFAAADPVSLATLVESTGCAAEDVQNGLVELQDSLQGTGLRLALHHTTYQLVTAPEAAAAVQRYLQGEAKSDLSRAALETLAIVAYRGPITKTTLEELRGVSSDTMLRNLLQRGLINEAGKAPEAGRPTQYTVSHRFLNHFGLASTAELPPLDDTK